MRINEVWIVRSSLLYKLDVRRSNSWNELMGKYWSYFLCMVVLALECQHMTVYVLAEDDDHSYRRLNVETNSESAHLWGMPSDDTLEVQHVLTFVIPDVFSVTPYIFCVTSSDRHDSSPPSRHRRSLEILLILMLKQCSRFDATLAEVVAVVVQLSCSSSFGAQKWFFGITSIIISRKWFGNVSFRTWLRRTTQLA